MTNETSQTWGQIILTRIDKLDPLKCNDNKDYDSKKDHVAFPATLGNKEPKYFRRIEDLLIAVQEEFMKHGPLKMFQRDAKLWYLTIQYAGTRARREFLKRLFTVLRFGGFMYCSEKGKWKYWEESGFPIASAMSHGSRVMIQTSPLHEESKSKRDHSFWNWLVTGNKNGEVADFISTDISGDNAEKEKKIIFKRLGATHGIEYGDESQVEILPDGRVKYLVENKPLGINFRNTKILSSDERVLGHHRHWGMNVPVGGHGRTSLIGEKISANGEHGHLYIYYMSSAPHRCGGILIGLEGSEYNKWDQVGHKHALIADSSTHSPTYGFKWHHKSKKEDGQPVDLSGAKGPLKYNGMFIDLSMDWEFLEDHYKNWKDEWVMETALRGKKIEKKREGIVVEKPIPLEEQMEKIEKIDKPKRHGAIMIQKPQVIVDFMDNLGEKPKSHSVEKMVPIKEMERMSLDPNMIKSTQETVKLPPIPRKHSRILPPIPTLQNPTNQNPK